jgi:hypothetical protein
MIAVRASRLGQRASFGAELIAVCVVAMMTSPPKSDECDSWRATRPRNPRRDAHRGGAEHATIGTALHAPLAASLHRVFAILRRLFYLAA